MAQNSAGDQTGETIRLILEVVGGAAALVGWFVFIGGAHEAARFDAAGLPSPVRVASTLPREQLLAVGARTLAPSVAIGVALALLVFFFSRVRFAGRDEWVRKAFWARRRPRLQQLALSACLALIVIAAVLALISAAIGSAVVALIAVGAFVLALAAGLVSVAKSSAVVATSAFLAALGVGGVIQTLGDVDSASAQLDRVVVDRRAARSTVAGYLIARGGDSIDVAVLPETNGRRTSVHELSVLSIPKDEIETVVVGRPVRISDGTVVVAKRSGPPPEPVTHAPTPTGPDIGPPPTSTGIPATSQVTVVLPPAPDGVGQARGPQVVLTQEREAVDRRGVFRVSLGPLPQTARLVVKVYAYRSGRRAGAHHRLKAISQRVNAGGRLTIHVKLPPSFRSQLSSRRQLRARVAIRAIGSEGQSSVRTRLLILRSPSAAP
jgi:hypothetical protein